VAVLQNAIHQYLKIQTSVRVLRLGHVNSASSPESCIVKAKKFYANLQMLINHSPDRKALKIRQFGLICKCTLDLILIVNIGITN